MLITLTISLGLACIGLVVLAVIAIRAGRAGQVAAQLQNCSASREKLSKLDQTYANLDARIKELEGSKQLQGKRIGDTEISLVSITEELKKINATLQDHRVSITTLMLKVAVVGGLAGTVVPALVTFAIRTFMNSYVRGGG